MNSKTIAIRFVKSIFFKTKLYKYFLPVMKFDMSIAQINLIIESINQIRGEGVILEIGVGGGATSVLINHAIKQMEPHRQYIAIDTFSGFTDEDISYENNIRGKNNRFEFYKSNSNTFWVVSGRLKHISKIADFISGGDSKP